MNAIVTEFEKSCAAFLTFIFSKFAIRKDFLFSNSKILMKNANCTEEPANYI
jgi:hypothetical protein